MKGSVRKRGSSYEVQIYLGRGADGKKRRHTKTLSTKKAADRYCREKIAELEATGTLVEAHTETLAEFLADWLDTVAASRVKQRTLEDYREKLERHVIKTKWGNRMLRLLTPDDVQGIYNDTLKRARATGKGSGVTSTRRVHSILSTALKTAVKRGLIVSNPCKMTDLPRDKKKTRRRIIEPKEIPQFVQAALKEERLAALWVLAVTTGMRPGELLGLRWSDLSDDLEWLTVNQVLVRPTRDRKGQAPYRFEDPKTEESQRTLSVSPEVAELLRHHRAQQAAEKLAAGHHYEDHGLVFATTKGTPLHQHNLSQRVLPRILARAGLPKGVTPYSLRHSAATALLEAQENLKIVSAILGHSSVQVTGDVYSHVLKGQHKRAASKLSALAFSGQQADSEDSDRTAKDLRRGSTGGQ